MNLKLLHALGEKLEHLQRMKAHLEYSRTSVLVWWRPDIEFDALTPQQLVELVALKARFAELQDHLASAMRLVTEIEEEPVEMFTYVLSYMTRVRVIDSIEAWREVRELRNAATHDYAAPDIDKVRHFSQLLQRTDYMLQTLANLKRVVETAPGNLKVIHETRSTSRRRYRPRNRRASSQSAERAEIRGRVHRNGNRAHRRRGL